MTEKSKINDWLHQQQDKTVYKIVNIFNVEYLHIKLPNDDDLYITELGLPFIEHLKPENFWTDKEWFNNNSKRLSGTSTIYKMLTKKINNFQKEIIIKWNRMGQDVPESHMHDELHHAEFNSPFEEFSLVMQLRHAMYHPNFKNIIIQQPLAIYTPFKRVNLWETGRKEYKLRSKINSHKDITLDMNRLYAVIYGWIKGTDGLEAYNQGIMDIEYLKYLTNHSNQKICEEGFVVRDPKPQHIILRLKKDSNTIKTKNGKIYYGLIDFELLQRTKEKDKELKKQRRSDYLTRQRDRFTKENENQKRFYPYLNYINILNVDYIYGQVESTKGALWVVGDDPFLFDYFLPEKWEYTPKIKLSPSSQVYFTTTKDNIKLVWKVSKVGIQPNGDPFKEDEKRIIEYGYNSPFEEFSLALELKAKGIPAIYPRAIYVTGNKTIISENFLDSNRYETHKSILSPDFKPILKKDRDYITIWGFWNGPDEKLALKDEDYCKAINALYAFRTGVITKKIYFFLVKHIKDKLFSEGYEHLDFRGSHFLISIDKKGNLVKDNKGIPEIRICNFSHLKRI